MSTTKFYKFLSADTKLFNGYAFKEGLNVLGEGQDPKTSGFRLLPLESIPKFLRINMKYIFETVYEIELQPDSKIIHSNYTDRFVLKHPKSIVSCRTQSCRCSSQEEWNGASVRHKPNRGAVQTGRTTEWSFPAVH